MTDDRLMKMKQRVQQHQAQAQQLEGRRQSFLEQRTRYVDELSKAGLTPDQLPERIAQLEQQAQASMDAAEQHLASVGA